MAFSESCLKRLHHTLSLSSMQHALEVLAEATGATVVLFDDAKDVLVGPVAGNDFIRRVISTAQGREAVLSAHRAAIGAPPDSERGTAAGVLAAGPLHRFVIPVMRDGRQAGTMTVGDRPRQPIPAEFVARIETAAGLDPGELRKPARELTPWSAAEASAARNMAALVAELFSELSTQVDSLRNRIEELTAVYSISGLLAGTLDLQQILDRTARMVCEVMKAKACGLRLLDETTGNLALRAVHNLSQEYLNKGRVTVGENPVDAAAVQGQIVQIADAPSDPRTRYPQQAKKEGIVSGLVCGMIYRGKAVGVLRVYTGEPHVFTPFEESLLRAVASQAAAAIVNARLVAETIEAELYTRQIAYAGEVQRRMIPAEPPASSHLDIGAIYRPTFDVGGDFYDFILLPSGNLGVGIADVSGKGVPASLLMASLRSALRVHACFTYDIHRIMAGVNQHVCRETTLAEFATAFYGVASPDGRRLTYCNAVHDPPMLLRDGRIQYLRTGGMLLGIDPDATFEQELVALQPGDVLLLYTDGAVEAMNFTDEQFGRPRLEASLLRYADQPAQRVAENILWDIRRFRGLADRIDDLTLVVLKVR